MQDFRNQIPLLTMFYLLTITSDQNQAGTLSLLPHPESKEPKTKNVVILIKDDTYIKIVNLQQYEAYNRNVRKDS